MADNVRQQECCGMLDDCNAHPGRRNSLNTENADLIAFREARGQLFSNCDFTLISSPWRGYAADYHRSSTENAIFDGYYEDEQPRHAPLGSHLQYTSTELGVIDSKSMDTADCPMLDIVDLSTTATEVMRVGSLFSSSIAEGTGGDQHNSQRFTVDATEICDKEPTTIPPARCVVAQIDQDTQDIQDTHDQDTQVAQDIGQMHENTDEQSEQEGLKDGIKKDLEKEPEKEFAMGQLDDREATPLSPESPQPSSPESWSDDSSDSTAAITTETAKMTLNGRTIKRRRSDHPGVRKKNKRDKRTAQGMGPPPGSQPPEQGEKCALSHNSGNPTAAQVPPVRPLQPMPERALLPKHRQDHLPIETPPSRKRRAAKKKYTDEPKENQKATRAAGTCTHCKEKKRYCDLANKQPGETCTSCAKRNAKRKAGTAPLTCLSWREAAS